MSHRPRQGFEGRVLIAQNRMAPGGRRWSESPVPREPRRRVRQMGVPVAVGPAYLFAQSTVAAGGGFAGGVILMPESTPDADALNGLTVQARLTVPAGVPTTGVSLTLRDLGWALADGPWAFPSPITPGQVLVSPPHTWPDPSYNPDTGGIVVYWLECTPVGPWMAGWGTPGNGLCEIRPT